MQIRRYRKPSSELNSHLVTTKPGFENKAKKHLFLSRV
jgi:hypothetical protein